MFVLLLVVSALLVTLHVITEAPSSFVSEFVLALIISCYAWKKMSEVFLWIVWRPRLVVVMMLPIGAFGVYEWVIRNNPTVILGSLLIVTYFVILVYSMKRINVYLTWALNQRFLRIIVVLIAIWSTISSTHHFVTLRKAGYFEIHELIPNFQIPKVYQRLKDVHAHGITVVDRPDLGGYIWWAPGDLDGACLRITALLWQNLHMRQDRKDFSHLFVKPENVNTFEPNLVDVLKLQRYSLWLASESLPLEHSEKAYRKVIERAALPRAIIRKKPGLIVMQVSSTMLHAGLYLPYDYTVG
jgi:hypothetical protein